MVMSLKVKLLIINPVGVDIWNELTLSYAKQVLSFDVEVVVRNIPGAPPYIETEYEKELVAPLVIKEVVKAGKEGFHGVIINCFDDPGLEGSREVSDIPVFGIGETSLAIALLLGYKIGIISAGREWSTLYKRRVAQLGIEKRVVYISGIEIPILEIRKNIERITSLLTKEIEKAVKEHEVDVVVLGCSGFIGLANTISKVVAIPVIDPTLVTLKVAESLLKLSLKHRKIKSPRLQNLNMI